MEFIPMASLAAFVVTVVNFIKFVKAKDVNGAATQLTVWVVGVGTVWLFAQTKWADAIAFGDTSLAAYDGWSLLVLGLTLGSVGTLANEFKKAFDNSDNAVKPPLIGSDSTPRSPD